MLRRRLLCLVVLVAACGGPSRPGGLEIEVGAATPAGTAPQAATAAEPLPLGERGYEIHPGVAVPESWVDCGSEDDCTIVEVGCCNHCNGGAITAINKAYATRAKDLIAKKLAEAGPCQPCAKAACDVASKHQLICMTRACHIDDLEDEVQERIWGASTTVPDDAPRLERAP